MKILNRIKKLFKRKKPKGVNMKQKDGDNSTQIQIGSYNK